MKIIMVMVMSLDGKTTKWGDPSIYKWTSREDQSHFLSLIKKYPVIIMGRKTYQAAKSLMRPDPQKLGIVMTNTPGKYAQESVAGQLEFSSLSPRKLVANLEARGYREALLAGGEQVNRAFLDEKAVQEIYLTVEPVLFGSGNHLISVAQFNIPLTLKSVEKLNHRGTLLIKYSLNAN